MHRHFLFLYILGSVFGGPVFAATVTPSSGVVNHVNVRDIPSSDEAESEIVGTLSPGERATHLQSIPYWYKVQLPNGIEGFVSKRWTDLHVGSPGELPVTVHFLDVGIGDSIIVDHGDAEIVIDAGNPKTTLYGYAQANDIIQDPIELGIVTHGDSDHWKGFVRLLGFDGKAQNPYQLTEFWEAGYDRDCGPLASFNTFIQDVQNHVGTSGFKRPLAQFHAPAIDSQSPQPFTMASFPGMTFTILHSDPNPTGSDCAYTINNASIVFKLSVNGVTFLFTGDANGKDRDESGPGTPSDIEAKLLALEAQHPGVLKADVLKVPHHGSETANTQAFVDAVDPDFVIISASTNHHLPRDTVLDRYEANDRVILRTDVNRAKDNDHILCLKAPTSPLVCNYRDQFVEQ